MLSGKAGVMPFPFKHVVSNLNYVNKKEVKMKIDLIHKPENKTNYEAGDTLCYEGSPTRFMVVGEDDIHLHTFIIGTGQYWGVFKLKPENLNCLIRVK